jgi:D-sedoheptulose 7-phosphate isomerase
MVTGFKEALRQHLAVFDHLKGLQKEIETSGQILAQTIQDGNKILVCGNGGSAADAQHFAAEIVGRFLTERNAWPAIALTTDTSILTAVANDYGYAEVFARQVQGLGYPGDAFIGISTSGDSESIDRAMSAAKAKGLQTIALLGGSGGRLKGMAQKEIILSGSTSPPLQEGHIFILHHWARMIEMAMTSKRP